MRIEDVKIASKFRHRLCSADVKICFLYHRIVCTNKFPVGHPHQRPTFCLAEPSLVATNYARVVRQFLPDHGNCLHWKRALNYKTTGFTGVSP
eukprot:s2867_g10.t1